MPKRIYRVEVVSYPTPDGKPFKDQPLEHYWAAVDIFSGGCGYEESDVPEWLRGVNIDGWVWGDDPAHVGWDVPEENGYAISDDAGGACLNVPVVSRTHFFSRAAANRLANRLRHWGAVVIVHASKPIEWEIADAVSHPKDEKREQ